MSDTDESDPVLQALLNSPIGECDLSEEQRAELQETIARCAAGAPTFTMGEAAVGMKRRWIAENTRVPGDEDQEWFIQHIEEECAMDGITEEELWLRSEANHAACDEANQRLTDIREGRAEAVTMAQIYAEAKAKYGVA